MMLYINNREISWLAVKTNTGWEAPQDKRHWMMEASTSSPLSDRRMSQRNNKWRTILRLLTWHACQGYQIVRGQRWEQNKKQGTVLSQAGRARQVRELSVRQKQRLFHIGDGAMMSASNEIRQHDNLIFRNIQRWRRRWQGRVGIM